jgi:hypothetical protein
MMPMFVLSRRNALTVPEDGAFYSRPPALGLLTRPVTRLDEFRVRRFGLVHGALARLAVPARLERSPARRVP